MTAKGVALSLAASCAACFAFVLHAAAPASAAASATSTSDISTARTLDSTGCRPQPHALWNVSTGGGPVLTAASFGSAAFLHEAKRGAAAAPEGGDASGQGD